jgi:hypothetical protein
MKNYSSLPSLPSVYKVNVGRSSSEMLIPLNIEVCRGMLYEGLKHRALTERPGLFKANLVFHEMEDTCFSFVAKLRNSVRTTKAEGVMILIDENTTELKLFLKLSPLNRLIEVPILAIGVASFWGYYITHDPMALLFGLAFGIFPLTYIFGRSDWHLLNEIFIATFEGTSLPPKKGKRSLF